MTAAHKYDDLHDLVDQLTPDQAYALRSVALQLVVKPPIDNPPTPIRRRRLSFAGIMEAEPDLATRSEEILREERGKHAG